MKKYTIDLEKKTVTESEVPTPEAALKGQAHDCWDNAVPYTSDGALGHGWECGVCGAFLQAG